MDLTGNPNLRALYVAQCELTSIDVSNNPALHSFSGFGNLLTSLDVSNNTALEYFQLHGNLLTELDLSSNTSLTRVAIEGNPFTYLNMKNGLTSELIEFDARTNNNTLSCIETLDPEWASANWTYENENIDQGTTFDVICNSEARTKWYVSTSGSDLNGNGTSQSPLSSIQTALNAATEGDTVYVAAGIYYEHIVFNGSKNVELVGEDSSNTIIDAQQQNVVMNISQAQTSETIIKNFTLMNGITPGEATGLEGGGISINNASPTIENIQVKNNLGNGIGLNNSSAVFKIAILPARGLIITQEVSL